ncbi:sulfotransferase [Humisphaera borealis]|uniref:Sulfotransferase n=1 Tax=Humisphaera borealis TaxID=2807512 RepID=A0A7M2WUM5_9BACT|nr:sulfotransferase [Humisphaera borealis]QOV89227.1 sulfotransferase [Humisphaera borealis]
MSKVRSYAFVFVCQAGVLENKALLLAASLKRFLRCEHELIAAVPSPAARWGTLAADTTALLHDLGCRIEPITNLVADDYPIGNKISCMLLKTTMDRLVFIDSDILLTGPFDGDPAFDFPVAAKAVDLANLTEYRQWRRAYAAMKLKLPDDRVASTVYGQLVHPYFNAGLIAADPTSGFGDAWLESCRRIDAKWGVRLKRPHLDQIALPVAIKKLKLPYACLDERYNYPVHIKAIDYARPPLFAHYHSPPVLRREPMLVDLARDLCNERPALKQRIEADPEYAPLLTSGVGGAVVAPAAAGTAALQPSSPHRTPTPELIITGFPRSGTSYLCNLLHRYENCVVLNEPDGISRPLRKELIPYGVGAFYRDQRREILERRPILNKLKDGKVTDETMEANEQTQYLPAVTSRDFVLGVKSPLGFLSRLPAMRRAMPAAKLIVCIRNPFDVIASWKTTFSHLLSADVKKMSHGGLRDPFLSDRQRRALVDVGQLKNPAWRRAAWWRYLADQILDAVAMSGGANAGSAGLIVVPYTQAVTDPMSVMGRIFEGFNPGTLREPIEPSTVRAGKRDALDAEDLQAIRAVCLPTAALLGVAQ